MADARRQARDVQKTRGRRKGGGGANHGVRRDGQTGQFVAVEVARKAGLLESGASEHLSFRVPKALIEAARRETGVQSPTALGILALATVAQPDPVVAFMKRTRGRLGADAALDT